MQFDSGAQLDTGQVQDERGGGGGGFPGGTGGIIGVIVTIIAAAFGIPTALSSGSGSSNPGTSSSAASSLAAKCQTGAQAQTNDDCRVVAIVNSVQDFWQTHYPGGYQKVPTVLYTGQTNTGCGAASSAVGPFYCPADRTVYLDLGFWQDLHDKFGARGGPFAQAYVLAHEYGHHIQDLQGTLGRAQADRQGPQSGSVRTELQADCYAGVWAHSATTTKDAAGHPLIDNLTQQDVGDRLEAAGVGGGERIQSKFPGKVTPETWTHGSSAERQKWFTTGYQTGDMKACDTFSGSV